jgi:hypothetical protein
MASVVVVVSAGAAVVVVVSAGAAVVVVVSLSPPSSDEHAAATRANAINNTMKVTLRLRHNRFKVLPP